MANFLVCYNWMMDNEDRARACTLVDDKPDIYQKDSDGQLVLDGEGMPIRIGAYAISGVNSAAYPRQYATIAALPRGQRQAAVQTFYETEFWNRWYAQLNSDEVAKRILDAAVNMGPVTAVKLAQQAAGCAVDGVWGPATVTAVNAVDPVAMTAAFKRVRLAHYQAIVAAHPADAVYLGTAVRPGPWWIRAVT